MDPRTYIRHRNLDALLCSDATKALALARELVVQAMRQRRSGGPRGSLERAAMPLVDEAPLVALVRRVVEQAELAPILALVGEWGGWRSADEIAQRLDDPRHASSIREEAITTLRTLGGERAVRTLANIATSRPPDACAVPALDALEALAWAQAPEVAEGGAVEVSLTAEQLWRDHRATLERTALGRVIAQLERASAVEHDQVDLVRAALLTSMEPRFREIVSAKVRPSVRRRTIDDARGIPVVAELT